MTQPAFGELIIDTRLPDNSPKKTGYFVRRFDRLGGFNPGPAYQVTDKAGSFWDIREEYAVKTHAQGPDACRHIIIRVEGGMVADVTGIPAGCEVHVHDHDEGDTSHPSWDAEKGCFVTVYGGEEL